MANKSIRDLLLFFVFAGMPIVNFWLQGYPERSVRARYTQKNHDVPTKCPLTQKIGT
jgi:hypothetical protein